MTICDIRLLKGDTNTEYSGHVGFCVPAHEDGQESVGEYPWKSACPAFYKSEFYHT